MVERVSPLQAPFFKPTISCAKQMKSHIAARRIRAYPRWLNEFLHYKHPCTRADGWDQRPQCKNTFIERQAMEHPLEHEDVGAYDWLGREHVVRHESHISIGWQNY